jgi:type IV pilus assembly protein PilM
MPPSPRPSPSSAGCGSPEASPAVSSSIWKKQISLRRQPKDETPATVEAEPVPELEHATAVEPAPEATPEPERPVDAYPPAELPMPKGDYGWLTTSFDPNDLPDEMPAIVAPPVSGPPPVRVPLAETATPSPVDLAPVQPPPAGPAAPGATAPESKPTPFWKKELSLGRGSKEPKAAKQAKAPKQPKSAKEPKRSKTPKEEWDPAEQTLPFWKRELSLGRKPKARQEAAAVKEPKEKKPPFWKRELKLGRAPKEATEPTAVKQPKEKKPPIWKRELKLGRTPKEAVDLTAVKEPKEKKPSFWTLQRAPKGAKGTKAKKQPKPKQAKVSKSGIVGLKIGASQVAAARVTNNGGTPQLLQVARAPLADGVVVGGELRDIETLAQTLKELFAKHKLPKKGIRLGIANNRIGVRTFEIAGIDDDKQLANAIKFRAQETLPIPLEEAVLDWQLLSESTDEETGQTVRRVLLVVAYRELVERYVLACKKAGITVAGIDLEAFAMLRALADPSVPGSAPATGAQVVVNVGHDRSTFAVSDGRVCEFTRVLGWGGQNLSVAIARALDITPSEATPIKHALSLVAQSEPPEGIAPEALGAAREAVTRELQSFARELVSSLRFYQNQPGSLGIGQLVLTGGSAHLPGFADELNRLIGVPVTVGDPLNRVAIPKKFREPEYALGSLTVAIGLGIED